jgi:hypothetical protein
MAEFLQLGRQRINVAELMSVTEEPDGSVTVRSTTGHHASYPPDEGAIVLAYVDGNLAGGKPLSAEVRPPKFVK